MSGHIDLAEAIGAIMTLLLMMRVITSVMAAIILDAAVTSAKTVTCSC